jgi:hypothetical protein
MLRRELRLQRTEELMDPNEALREWNEAVKANDREGAFFAAGNLIGWLERGGPMPAWSPEVRAKFFDWVERNRNRQ